LRFVSRSANYRVVVRPDDQYEYYEEHNGNLMPKRVKRPSLVCAFRHGMVPPDEAYAATMHWNGTPSNRTDPERVDASGHSVPDIFGAVPYQRAVTLRNSENRIIGVTNPSRPDFNYSLFDTAWIDDPDDRRLAEESLLENPQYGSWYIKVEKQPVPAPWPNYDKVRRRGNKTIAEIIVERVREDGYDVGHVIAYEISKLNREDVLEALNAYQKELDDKAELEESLEVEVA